MNDYFKIMLFFAALSVGLFFWFADSVTTVEHPAPDDVNLRYRSVLLQFHDPTPMLRMDPAGRVIHNTPKSRPMFPVVPTDLIVVAWRGPEVGLVEVRMPIWFLRVKGPAVRYLLRDTGFEPDDWALALDDMQDWGAGVVLDHYDRAGNRLLVWTD